MRISHVFFVLFILVLGISLSILLTMKASIFGFNECKCVASLVSVELFVMSVEELSDYFITKIKFTYFVHLL